MKHQQFTVTSWRPNKADNIGKFTLVKDSWNDFGYRTLYRMYFTETGGDILEIGDVKIASMGMSDLNPTTDLSNDFDVLPDNFFSLGQDREYYEKLMALPDQAGHKVLFALNDIAANVKNQDELQNEDVFTTSLLRGIPFSTVKTQFKRIIDGSAVLTKYQFSYTRNFGDAGTPILELDFTVKPESTPPTNLHVLIGSNGVGKSLLLRDFVAAASKDADAKGGFLFESASWANEIASDSFVNVVHVSFSAFDEGYEAPISLDKGIKVHSVGLERNGIPLHEQFIESLRRCGKGPRCDRWKTAIDKLEFADPLLNDIGFGGLFKQTSSFNEDEVTSRFKSMSSGHKIVILTVTRLVELVEEQSLVLIDEPETHLHPPLLSALVRAVSDLIVDRNAVTVIATHSPVVLQEVPTSCVWRLQRSGNDMRAFRLDTESFGESVSRLTAAVFHLDVRKTGYHEMLNELIEQKGSASSVLDALNNQLGDEGRFVLSSLDHMHGHDNV